MHVPGGERDDACDHGLSRRSLRVKTSYELSWKVKVMIKKRKKEKKGTNINRTVTAAAAAAAATAVVET